MTHRRRVWAPAAIVVLSVALLASLIGSQAALAVPSQVPEEAFVTDRFVSAIAPAGNRIYIGGGFTYVGPNTGSAVPVDGTGEPLAKYPKVNGSVYSVIPDGSGGFYLGGFFSTVGGVQRNNLAHVLADGSVDPAFNPNANFGVYALALSGSTLYVGGQFESLERGGQHRR
jgi:Domain of unknown function (DUF5122) beta-propeller